MGWLLRLNSLLLISFVIKFMSFSGWRYLSGGLCDKDDDDRAKGEI